MKENKRTGERHTVSCAEIADTLLSSEIFGHEKGAFTGAIKNHTGKLASCDKGILFLDELGNASPEFQAAILRVTDNNSFSPVGSNDEKKVDVRIIAATSSLSNIRDDLKHRFNHLPIPPLWRFDIPKLVEKCLGQPLKENIIKGLMSKEYPGNVRDLLRECDKLKAEMGEKIFGIRPYQGEYHHLDYNRFRFEYEVWCNYIQPILDKHRIKDLRYGAGGYRWKSYRPIPIGIIPVVTSQLHAIVDVILHFGDGGSVDIPTLVTNLRDCKAKGRLPSLLDMLNDAVNPRSANPTVEFPDFTHLLEYPFKKVCKRFEVIYLEHKIKQHGGIPSAAAALKMDEEAFRSRLKRARKAIKDKGSN